MAIFTRTVDKMSYFENNNIDHIMIIINFHEWFLTKKKNHLKQL